MSETGGGIEDGIEVTRGDILDYWVGHVDSTSRVTLDEVNILPANFDGRVVFAPYSDGWAGYDPITNEIRVGKKATTASEAMLEGMLRHEQSHYTLGNMSENDQRELTDFMWLYHEAEIRAYYSEVRRKYEHSYFDPENVAQAIVRWKRIGRGRRIIKEEDLWYRDTLERVELGTLIDEMIAFAVTTQGRESALPELRELEAVFGEAGKIVENVHPVVREILERNGFLNIDAKLLVSKLKEDDYFLNPEKYEKLYSDDTWTVNIEIDGQSFDVDKRLSIGWTDILKSRLDDPLRVPIKVPVSGLVKEEYDAAVLSDLRQSVSDGRKMGVADKEIFRQLLSRYHPDFHNTAGEVVLDLANEYTKALFALKKSGEINPQG